MSAGRKNFISNMEKESKASEEREWLLFPIIVVVSIITFFIAKM